MPLYDYRCTECAREVEVIHAIHDKGPATCQHCGGAMRKALSSPAIHFKGSGWAKKDARKAAPSKASASGKGPANGTAGTDGATDTKAGATDTTKTESTSGPTDSKTASPAGASSD